MIFQWLHILDINDQNITRLRGLDLKWPSQVVHLCQVHILHVIRIVRILDLTTSPVDALDLDRLAVFDFAGKGNYIISKSSSTQERGTCCQDAIGSGRIISGCRSS